MADGKQIVPLSEGPENVGWLINIMKGEAPQTRAKPLIQKVSRTLREIESNKSCFDPLVVSLGPYHHGQERLMQMEDYKSVAARWFVSLATHNKPPGTITDMEVQVAYQHFITVARESCPTHCYADKFFLLKFTYNDFMRMMFLDGCFILHFIHLVVEGSDELSNTSHLNQPLILRDMFLLENQIPYSILKALMSLLQPNQSNEINRFIELVFLLQHKQPRSCSNPINLFIEFFPNFKKDRQITSAGSKSANTEKEGEPFHLLDFLRSKLIGKDAKKSPPSASPESGYWQYYFRSIMELKTAGIKLRRSKSKCLKDIQFRSGIFDGHLQLPQFMVDDATKTRLLNLIAYEMCPDGLSDRAVTSYICFLDSLIDHAEDVKELRSKNILLNRLGSDEKVANLFNELANNLTPNSKTYSDVMQGIEKHSRSRVKVWIAEFTHTHFTSPWTVMALMAAIFVILLTVAQTYYSAVSYYNPK
ncbi:UPF0481-like protein [Cinnamomum micranthum f. kanehirae]|uniref:UPF0481-like protein n=1 Tax=Cinnamomum micranthum f. kanehirae TaxID=337451 RepID=A0A3S3N8F0_9MAGN|nr:UPF0481-like protein [Cinnamomum micranthum f. kanehirae]